MFYKDHALSHCFHFSQIVRQNVAAYIAFPPLDLVTFLHYDNDTCHQWMERMRCSTHHSIQPLGDVSFQRVNSSCFLPEFSLLVWCWWIVTLLKCISHYSSISDTIQIYLTRLKCIWHNWSISDTTQVYLILLKYIWHISSVSDTTQVDLILLVVYLT